MSNLFKSEIEANFSDFVFSDHSPLRSRVSEIIIKGQNIGFSIDISNISFEEATTVKTQLIAKLQRITGIGKINIVFTASKAEATDKRIIFEEIGKIIVVAAGKGGVGKSTISSLLAQKLANDGYNVGLLDADIYGPSIPSIFNLNEKPIVIDKKMIPLENYGVKINSIGFITDPNSSISWRGPMTSKALYQLISLTKWQSLDYLIIDTPPGTGDIHLSLLQNYAVSGVIMVTTPQKIAAIDVLRAINLYKKFNVPILGLIENMSFYVDEVSGKHINIFPGKSGELISVKHKIPLIAQVPLTPQLAKEIDEGNSLRDYFELLNFDI